ncbi:bifunctional 3-(3-hydroxy-phenyl)propionate/3-hydroxycinnamic acid hydroxylase [Candidatus Pelagibacter sp.]|nr:bifunctional 3-(3-hydroxy-phenyl)propionate/3-hydroxycinnamic acid hydroxylase [Candidatus Pelagibacter sp.]
MKKYDVAIVGFGPTGGTLANLLALQGFSILIIEKEKSFYPLPRAVHFDDEIMRVFQTIGITDKFLKHTIINKGTKFVNSKNRVVLDWPRPRSITENGWYPSYRFHQPDLERKLRRRLKDFKKVSVMQNTKVNSLKEEKNSVKICIENINNNKISEIRAKYIIGCDGARSTIRKQIKAKFQNLGFTQKWAVVDLILKKNKKELPDRTIQYSNSKRPATYCRNVGKRRRWEFAINNKESEKKVLSNSYIWNFLKPWLKPSEALMERKTIYTFQSAISKKWKKGRVFLAGDAAHLMPPFMGQGMCAGVRDASNLAWKIAYCLKNNHSEKLLNTYQSERYSNVIEYIKTTVKMGEFVNAVGTSNITGEVSSTPNGQKSMKSIKPKLGKGLGKINDKNRGKIFPQFKLKNGKSLDNKFFDKPLLIISSKYKKKLPKKINYINSNTAKGLNEYMLNLKIAAFVVRPDRFILNSINLNKFDNLKKII